MTDTEADRYWIAGDLTVDRRDERAFLSGRALSLSPKPFALLVTLMAGDGVLVGKTRLFDEVWGGVAVGDAVLTTAIKELRQALGDSARSPDWIETVHGKGYRFLKPVDRRAVLSVSPVTAVGIATAGASTRADPDAAATKASATTSHEGRAALRMTPPSPRGARPVAAIAAGALALVAIGFLYLSRGPEADRQPSVPLASTSGKPAAPARSIAVLPFDDMSPAGDQAYFSDGVAEEILNALVRAPGLRVAARTSSFAFKDREVDLREIGRQLNVAAVLEGSVRKQGDSVRVTAQLIQASDGYHLWSETYDGSLADIFELQERIARSVADELAILLDLDGGVRLARRLTSSEEAYDLFLRARALVAHRFSEGTLSNAIELLDEAVKLDPSFAEAWAELGRATYFLPQYMPVADADPYLDRSTDAAARALALNPALPRAYLAIAGAHSYRGEFVETHKSLSKALELDPNDADIVGAIGYYWSYLGHPERAIPFLTRAVELDPVNVSNLFTLGVAELNAARYDEAERHMRRCLELGHTPAALVLPQIVALKGEREEAARLFAGGFEMASLTLRSQFVGAAGATNPSRLVGAALYGDDEAALTVVRDGLARIADDPARALNPAVLGVMLQAGAYDLFMRTFETRRFGGATFVLNIIWDDRPQTAGLRRHPAFSGFAERVGLADAWRVHGAPEGCAETAGGGFTCS